MLAKISGLFRLTRDVEIVQTQSGMSIAKFGLACSEKYKDKETQLFLDAAAFGKAGEIIAQYAGSKGTQIMLSGKLQTESWEKDGQKRSKVSMTIEDFDFVSNKGASQGQPQQQQHGGYGNPNKQGQQQQQYNQPMPQQPLPIDNDQDIPF